MESKKHKFFSAEKKTEFIEVPSFYLFIYFFLQKFDL